MGSAALDLDVIIRIPPTSPSRRDYGIRTPPRSPSPVNFDLPSRPQSPWLPHGQVLSPASRQAETFRLYESNPPPLSLDRTTTYYSGPLPAAPPQGDEHRSLPSYSGPLPGFPSAATESFEFSTWARVYHRQYTADEGSDVPGSPGTPRDGRVSSDDLAKRDASATSTFYLASPVTQFGARAGMHGRVGSVSGELGRSSDDVAKQRSLMARGYKSGEIGLGTDGVGEGNAVDTVRKERWESLSSNCDEPMVTIPFKWEEAASVKAASTKSRSRASSLSAPKSHSRASSVSTSASAPKPHSSVPKAKKSAQVDAGVGDFSFGSSHTKAESGHGSEAGHASGTTSLTVAKPVKPAKATPPTPPAKAKSVARSAVPFKWEDAPGKPKRENTTKTKTEASTPPSLQLPPRLASASVKRGSWSTSTPPSTIPARRSSSVSRARPPSHSSPDSSSSSKQVKPLRQPSPQPLVQLSQSPSPQPSTPPRHALGPNFLSGPLDSAAKPKPEPSPASKSGPMSQQGFPQHQSVDFFSIRSPTSTLQGPGSSSSDGHSHSENCSRKSPSVTDSQSGTSAESLEHWSEHDFESETARNLSSNPSLLSSTPLPPPLSSPCSSSKPPLIPFAACSSNPALERTVDPPSRLPYKMPSEQADVVVAVTRSSPSMSPARLRSNSRCFELPRFLNRSSEQVSLAWDAPSSASEDGYRSPAYKATLELLSPSPSLSATTMTTVATSKSRGGKLGSASPRHFVEGLRSSLKHSFHIFSKRKSAKSSPVIVHADLFTKRHPALAL